MKRKPFTLFVVEDDEWYNNLITYTLSLNPEYAVKSFRDAKSFLDALPEQPDVVTLDFRLPDSTGLDILKSIKATHPECEVIIISEQDNVETAVDLLKEGAYDYLVKTTDIRDRLLNLITNIKGKQSLKERISQLEKEVEKKYDFQSTIIGQSEPILKLYDFIAKAVESNINVSVTGETGTGKELVAKAIHYNSAKRKKPFVAVNIAAIPSELIESELFGHEKGAFTGAATRRIGKFEEASGGTLFLDEIGEMNLNLQSKLLRALQEKEIVRVGSNTAIPVDCRIIIATHKNLKEETRRGNFREDLYYRLIGLPIELPPLRDRGKDVLILAKHFITEFCKTNNTPEKRIAESAQQKMLSYSWKGNVRELKSIIELAVVLSSGNVIEADDIKLGSDDVLPEVMSNEITLRDYNLRIVSTYLKNFDNDIPLVAKKLDISQATIYRMLKEMKGESAS
ncbi:MAG: sigma-54 dependent transcriptional regulator [Bacteroidia bacterium]